MGEPIRSFADAAMAKPHRAITYMRELLGRTHRKDCVYGPHTFSHSVKADEARGGCMVEALPGEQLSPEALNAMLLTWAKTRAQEHTGLDVVRCVITVPPSFTQSQRRALLDAASIAGLEAMALLSDGAAAALKYGMDWINFQSLDGPKRVIFHDVGATGSKAALVDYIPVGDDEQDEGYPAGLTLGRIRVVSTSWDSTAGGAAITDRLSWAISEKSTKVLGGNERALARLRKAANKAKEVLSANKETSVNVEDIVGTYDLKAMVTRAEMEMHVSDICSRCASPVLELISQHGLVQAVEVIGNAWRVIAVQNEISSALGGGTPSKSLNSDEFGANGAALYGAYMDNRDRVRIEAWDAFPYEVSISVDDVCSSGQGLRTIAIPKDSPIPLLHRGHATKFWARVTPVRDFSAALVYSGAPASDESASHTPGVLDTYAVTGLETALTLAEAQAGGGTAIPKWVDMAVSVDQFGLVKLERAVLTMSVSGHAPRPPPTMSKFKFKIPPKATMRPSPGELSRGVSGWGDTDAEGTQQGGQEAQGSDEGTLRQEELVVTLLREGAPGGGCIASADAR